MENSYIDFVVQIKNGYLADKEKIICSYSKFREKIAQKLETLGFIKKFNVEGEVKKKMIIELDIKNKQQKFTDIKIFSKPGRRYYISYKDLKPVLGGLGVSIISTSKGILTDREAKKLKVGGELLFNIW